MSQNTTKAKPIKALGGYNKKSPTENLASANAVHSGIFTDPADYPTPPIDELTFKGAIDTLDRKSTRLNSSHLGISYAVFCLKKKKITPNTTIICTLAKLYSYCETRQNR